MDIASNINNIEMLVERGDDISLFEEHNFPLIKKNMKMIEIS